MKMKVDDEMVERFQEYLRQPQWTNRWATNKAVKSALKYALNPHIGLDGKYECDKIGCANRVRVAGERCDGHV